MTVTSVRPPVGVDCVAPLRTAWIGAPVQVLPRDKKSVAAIALRCMNSNRLQRKWPSLDLPAGTILTRPTKNDVSIMSNDRPLLAQRNSTRRRFGCCMKPYG